MFSYHYMRIAFICGLMLAIILPLIGNNLVLKRISLEGDALAHSSLAGIAIGLVAGYNPLIISIISCILSSLLIEFIRKKYKKYADLSIAIVLSFGIALAGILSSFTQASNFNSYLFGSILLITNEEVYILLALFIIIIAFNLMFYKQIQYIAYQEEEAKVAGIKVNIINIVETVLTSIAVAIASKIIGSLIVSSIMIIPIATSMRLTKSYKNNIILSIIFSIFSIIIGLIASYYLNLKSGATIVMVEIIIFTISFIYLSIRKKIITNAIRQK